MPPATPVSAGKSSGASGTSLHVNPIAVILAAIVLGIGIPQGMSREQPAIIIAAAILALLILLTLRMANAWEKAVVLRAGRFTRLAGPGLFVVLPIIDGVAMWIDQRVRTSTFTAEQTLTKDTVPVDVDAVLFWTVWDPKKAALEVTSYRQAIEWASQTALRDIIGTTKLADLLSDRQTVDAALQKAIDERTTPWGVTVSSVEIRDINIPESLQDAMSRQAQAERESQARVILGDAERLIASSFVEAAREYQGNPVALHLRAMNMLYEGLKEKGAMIVVPSSAVETMGLGAITGLSSMAPTVIEGAAPHA
jgi:regulator of protease activity HflC (stomatin/prohibitin superfamily)